MSQIDTTTASALSMLAGFNTAYGTANANNGEGGLGEWPPHGKWACAVTSITIKPETKKIVDKKTGLNHEFPGVSIQFHYRCNDVIPTQKDPAQPLEWKGAPFFLASNPASIPAGLSWLTTMNADRLKGHLTCINGTVGSNIQADLQAAIAKVSGDTQVHAVVLCEYKDAKQTPQEKAEGKSASTYKTEFLTESLAR
jgi:hypothetical protein